ncbi:RNA-dependent RNA polymerase [Erysiphe necator associated ourmia-like virus 45]|nr:RNA-dependent RNA polymerase [Erysiphe necator associated ourmia-like virus 45]
MVISLKSERAGQDRLRRVLRQLTIHLDYTSSLSSLNVPRLPELLSIEDVKKFTDLIDPTAPHPWREWYDKQEEIPRYRFAHSLFLFRKLLPGGSKSDAIKKFIDKMTVRSSPVDPAFLEFCRKEIVQLFPIGWDRSYRKVASNLCLSTSSCLERSRIDLGSRGVDSPLSRLAFQRSVGMVPFSEGPHRCKVAPVPSGGKWRVVTVNSCENEALKPYHHLLYDHLSRRPWLCRGDPKVKNFHRSSGEVFTSGDYESATDAIPLELYQFLLGLVSDRSVNVPDTVKTFAMRDSKKVFYDGRGNFLGNQERGQLMGSYLSFPFLCLLNYLCFKFSIRRNVPVLINGDDIVFRSTKEESERWMNNVQRCGLVLSRGKTQVHSFIFTLNSLLFKGGKARGKAIGFFRPKAYFSCPSTGKAAAGQFNSCVVGFSGHQMKRLIQSNFLKEYKNFLFKRQVSLHALGFRVSDVVLRMAGFLHHSRFYKGIKVPSRTGNIIPGGFEELPFPKGRGVARRNALASERLFYREMVELSWLPGQVRVEDKEVFGSIHMPPRPKPGLARALQRLRFRLQCNALSKKKEPEVRKRERTYWGRIVSNSSRGPIQWVRGEVLKGAIVEDSTETIVFEGRRR